MIRKIILSLGVAILILAPWAITRAMEPKTGNIYIGQNEILGGNLYAFGDSVTVDGSINGDLITVAQTVLVNGRIEGDILGIASSIIVNGEVGGNIRAAGSLININGLVNKNLNALGNSLTLGPNSRIGWDAYTMSTSLDSHGLVEGGLYSWADQIFLNGQINKNARLKLNDGTKPSHLKISEETVINGNLIYTAGQEAELSPQALIAGEIERLETASDKKSSSLLWWWGKILTIFGALVVGSAFVSLTRQTSQKALEISLDAPLKNFWIGLLVLVSTPLLSLILAITLIGLPLALITAALWLITIYLAKVLTAFIIGTIILERINTKNRPQAIYALIIGVIILWLLFALPYVGWLINLLAICFGLGGIWKYVKHQPSHI